MPLDHSLSHENIAMDDDNVEAATSCVLAKQINVGADLVSALCLYLPHKGLPQLHTTYWSAKQTIYQVFCPLLKGGGSRNAADGGLSPALGSQPTVQFLNTFVQKLDTCIGEV